MGAESQLRRLGGGRGKSKSPPIMSHDFVIQNHADIMSCVAMLFVAGLMFKMTAPLASMFVTLNYNVTSNNQSEGEEKSTPWLYTWGVKDLATVAFYTIICIVCHAALQEYVLDKVKNRIHLSKTKTAKFSESGQLAVFYVVAFGAAIYIIAKENYLTNITSLWSDYPAAHRELSFLVKLYFIVQISYWIHQFPEFYFQKVKREEIRYRAVYSALYLIFIGLAYILNFTRVCLCILVLHYAAEGLYHITRIVHFCEKPTVSKPMWRLWNVIFVLVRFGCVMLAVLTFWYGLRLSETAQVDPSAGNFNTAFIRLNCLLTVCSVQAWLMWNFICATLRRARERAPAPKKHYEMRTQQKKARKQQAEFDALPEADQHVRQRKN